MIPLAGERQPWDGSVIPYSSQMSGDEWQALVIQLLSLKYREDFKEIPDKHKGDFGLEGFTVDGCAFQCYSPEPGGDVADVARRHKKKLNADIAKFRDNSTELSKIFGPVKIRRWLLIVPDHCSAEVVQHSEKKAAEVRAITPPLPYVDIEFHVIVAAGHVFFPLELAAMGNSSAVVVEVEALEISGSQIVDLSSERSESVATLVRKIDKFLPTRTASEKRT